MSCAPDVGTTIVAHQLPCANQSFDSGFWPVTAPPAVPAVVEAYDCAWKPAVVVAAPASLAIATKPISAASAATHRMYRAGRRACGRIDGRIGPQTNERDAKTAQPEVQ